MGQKEEEDYGDIDDERKNYIIEGLPSYTFS